MFFKAALAVCLLPVFAAAQYGYGGGGGTTPTTSAASGAAAAPSAPASTSSQVNVSYHHSYQCIATHLPKD